LLGHAFGMQLRHPGLLALLVCTGAAGAAPAAEAQPERPVVLAPISTLGDAVPSKAATRIELALTKAIDDMDGFRAHAGPQVAKQIKRARRPELRACEGAARCLAELGKLMGAELTVYGELGGLGDAQVLTLKLVDTATGQEVRSTSAQFASGDDLAEQARAAAYRLLAPDHYVGSLALKVDIDGAAVYLNGQQLATTPSAPLRLPVGSHALRITHPEYRDYVRFVEIGFDRTNALEVGMKAFPIVDSEMRQRRALADPSDRPQRSGPTPWYQRWYTIAGAGALVVIGSALIVGALSDGIDADLEKVVGN
jgi:hypothetical protein